MTDVKSESRKERTAATRRRMLDSAYDLFCADGFRATTMEAIARSAEVAVQTLYFTFHTKDELLQAVQDRAVLGDDPLPPPQQVWFAEMRDAPALRDAVRIFADNLATILGRVAPLLPTFHAVAGDPAGVVWRRSEVLRREGYTQIVEIWATKAARHRAVSARRGVDRLFVLAGPEVYRSLTDDCGWSRRHYVDWLVSTIMQQLYDGR
ncbi:MAG: TetR/AcrR family transcriptional regulator [Ilumatobacteraceae bacterium]